MTFIDLIYFYMSQAMQNTERNGPNLRYVLSWRSKDTEEEWNNITTAKTKHIVHNTDTYIPYEIKIQAVNDFGHGPESNMVIGYSGEDSKYYHVIFDDTFEAQIYSKNESGKGFKEKKVHI